MTLIGTAETANKEQTHERSDTDEGQNYCNKKGGRLQTPRPDGLAIAEKVVQESRQIFRDDLEKRVRKFTNAHSLHRQGDLNIGTPFPVHKGLLAR